MVAMLERPRPALTAGDVVRALVRGIGQTLVTLGVVLLLFVVYELWVTDLLSDREQAQVADELRDEWGAPGSSTPSELGPLTAGRPFAFLHVPRLGPDWARAVVEGTAQEELAQGPGHYPGTALPGEQGNFAVAGHRVGRGSPFLDLDTLRPGDPVVVETADAWFTYRVLGNEATGDLRADASGIPGQQVVLPTDLRVISATPGAAPDTPASGAYLTITTCHPKFSARQRLVVHAVLDGAPVSKAAAPDGPPALAGR
jgi:sortase (surface protein transpeptidase)